MKKTGIPKIRIYPKWSHTNDGLGRDNKNLPRSCFYREHRREKPVHSNDMYPRELDSNEKSEKRTDMLIQSSCFMICIRSFSTS